MAFNRRTITKELDMANLAKHNDNYADIKTELDAHDSSISSHVAAQTAHGSTSAATAGKIVQRDSNGRAKVAAPVATDDIARKAEVDKVQTNLDDHEADAAVHLSAADRAKLDGVQDGAEPNQNAFSQVNDVVAAAETDTLTIEGGTGITISTNPTTKKVIVTATGEATPGPHGTSHNNDGADPIPDLVTLRSDFDTLTPADIGAETPAGAQAKVDALGATVNAQLVNLPSKQTVENSSLYMRAIDEISVVPDGSLKSAKSAIATGAIKIAYVGDSITEGLDLASVDNAFPSLVGEAIKTSLPNVTVDYFNFGVGSTSIANTFDPNFVGGQGVFTQPWAVPGKSWYDIVKDYAPNLIVIAFGMNDSTQGSKFEYDNLKTLVGMINSWNPQPSIIVVPNILSAKNKDHFWGYDNRYTLAVARAAREFAKDNKIACADANRLYLLLRDGIDDVARITDKEQLFDDFFANWIGDTSDFVAKGDVLEPVSGATNKFVTRTREFYNGHFEMHFALAGTGSANAAHIYYRHDPDLGSSMTVEISNSQVSLYSSGSPTPIASASVNIAVGAATRLSVIVKGSSHRILIDYIELINVKTGAKLQDGYITLGGPGLVPTFANMIRFYDDNIAASPFMNEVDLLGEYGKYGNGNGINHPTALGHRLAYFAAFSGVIKALATSASRPYCKLWHNGTFPIPSPSLAVPYNTEIEDGFNMHTEADLSKITIKVSGLYAVNAYITWNETVSGAATGLSLYKNGAVLQGNINALNKAQYDGQPLTAIVRLKEGDYLQIHAFQTSGSNKSLMGDTADRTYVEVAYIGE